MIRDQEVVFRCGDCLLADWAAWRRTLKPSSRSSGISWPRQASLRAGCSSLIMKYCCHQNAARRTLKTYSKDCKGIILLERMAPRTALSCTTLGSLHGLCVDVGRQPRLRQISRRNRSWAEMIFDRVALRRFWSEAFVRRVSCAANVVYSERLSAKSFSPRKNALHPPSLNSSAAWLPPIESRFHFACWWQRLDYLD